MASCAITKECTGTMDFKVRHSSGEVDKCVQHKLDEMDKNVQSERDKMDRILRQERAAVDRVMKQEQENMDNRVKHILEETVKRVKLEREDIDQKVRQERETNDRTMQQEHNKIEKQLEKILKEMAEKLPHERDNMDHAVELERMKMDCKNMQARAEIDHKFQQEREEMNSKALLEQVRREANMMEDLARPDPKDTNDHVQFHIPEPEQLDSNYPPELVMDFTIHMDFGERTGSMIFREPTKVEWCLMVENLLFQGIEGNADLYYLEPGCVAPDGLVLMSGPEHVEQMLQALKGRKQCHLYIVMNGSPSEDRITKSKT